MSEILDDIAYLSQEIGPRPAGTEEENLAAQYLAERFEKSASLRAEVEEFACTSQPGLSRALLFGIPALFTIISAFVAPMALAAFFVTLACAVLVVLELTGHPLLSRLFVRGVSQNVVAKYKPSGEIKARRRKVIVVANYDSSRVEPELGPLVGILPIIQKVSCVALALMPLFWIIRLLAGEGIFFTVVFIILAILVLLPVVQFIIHRVSAYNEGANSNASGAAALVELARAIQASAWTEMPEFEEGSGPDIYGKEAADQAGVLPAGVPVDYEAEPNAVLEGAPAPVDEGAAEAMRAETRAVFTGETPIPESDDFSYEDQRAAAPEQYAPVETALPQEEPTEEELAVPAWYAAAQKKANKPRNTGKVKRSRYADALDAAVAESSVHFAEANKVLENEAQQREEALSRGIVEVSAPERPEDIPPRRVPAAEAPAAAAESAPAAAPVVDEAPVAAEPQSETTVAARSAVDVRPAIYDFSEIREAPASPAPAPVFDDAPGATTAMAPIDVSDLQESVAANRTAETERTQRRPSLQVDRTEKRTRNRIVYDETSSATTVMNESPWEEGIEAERLADTRMMPRVTLPDVETQAEAVPSLDGLKQRAPLAEAAEKPANDSSNPSLSSRIPRIDASGNVATAEPDNKRAALRNMLPSMSGTISATPIVPENTTVSKTGSFAAVGQTGAFAPVGDELVADIAPEEMYIDDADDSMFEENVTTTGAYAGPGYVEMPKKRKGLFGRFRGRKKNDRDEELSTAGWLGVDEDFNPTEVGADRGSWESFQNESRDYEYGASQNDDYYDEFSDYSDYNERPTQRWNGGAFSKLRSLTNRGDAAERPAPAPAPAPARRPRREIDPMPAEFAEVAGLAAAKLAGDQEAQQVLQETQQVYDFRSSGVSTEVWFVALGSERAGNEGIKAFMTEHASELRGSIVINLESLGAGELAAIEEEGLILTRKPSSRVKRYLRAASQETGISPDKAKMNWRDSAASVAMRHGLQAMTLAGMEGGKPAYYGQGDDVIESIDEELLLENVAFVHSMLKSV